MIGARIDLEWDRFEYVWGLLVDEGLVPDEDIMPAGGATIVITEQAWGRLDEEARQEVARFMRASSEIEVRDPDPDGLAVSPAGARSGTTPPSESMTNEGAH